MNKLLICIMLLLTMTSCSMSNSSRDDSAEIENSDIKDEIIEEDKTEQQVLTDEYNGITYDLCFFEHVSTKRDKFDKYELFDNETKTYWNIIVRVSGKLAGIKTKKGYFEGDLNDKVEIHLIDDFSPVMIFQNGSYYLLYEDGHTSSYGTQVPVEDGVAILIEADPDDIY